jgi:uncharacterized protein (DUF885 family)
VLVASLEKRSAQLKDLSPQARSAAIARATRIVEEKIRPAYVRVRGFMAELHPKANDTAGISRLQGSIEARMKALDATFQPQGEGKGGEDPRPAILEKYRAMVADAQVRSEKLFRLKPRAPVEVLREPPLTEASAAAHYSLPAPDGSRPGVFWVPMRGPGFDMIRMRSLSYHEAVPGHHFQLAIQQELAGIPTCRSARIFSGGSAYAEGRALYAERLAVEQGWYEGDGPACSGSSARNCSAPAAWWSTPACIRKARRASRRSTTASTSRKSTATWSGRARPRPT